MQAVSTLRVVTWVVALHQLPEWYLCAAMVYQPPHLLLAETSSNLRGVTYSCVAVALNATSDAPTPLYSQASYEQTLVKQQVSSCSPASQHSTLSTRFNC